MSWEAEVAVLQDQIEALRQRVVPAAAVEPPRVPGVVEFVLSGEFLAKPTVFPRQARCSKCCSSRTTPSAPTTSKCWRSGVTVSFRESMTSCSRGGGLSRHRITSSPRAPRPTCCSESPS